jgi:hypothetical protein
MPYQQESVSHKLGPVPTATAVIAVPPSYGPQDSVVQETELERYLHAGLASYLPPVGSVATGIRPLTNYTKNDHPGTGRGSGQAELFSVLLTRYEHGAIMFPVVGPEQEIAAERVCLFQRTPGGS